MPGREKNIGRLQIAMDHTVGMEKGQRIQDRHQVRTKRTPALPVLLEGPAGKRHGEPGSSERKLALVPHLIKSAIGVHRHDVGMSKCCYQPQLFKEVLDVEV